MRFLLVLILSIAFAFTNAQDCSSHALMRKGSRLEYVTYATGAHGNFKMARTVFEVLQVMDSAGSRYSSIVKRGIAVNDTSDHYEKPIVLKCDGKNLLFPGNFFGADTTYLCDIYPTVKKRGYYLALTPIQQVITNIIPLQLDGVTKLPVGATQVEQKLTFRNFPVSEQPEEQRLEGPLEVTERNATFIIKDIRVEGKKTITTAAGSFTCYKVVVDSDYLMDSHPIGSKFVMYFNNEVGLVKVVSEVDDKDNKGGSVELVSVK